MSSDDAAAAAAEASSQESSPASSSPALHQLASSWSLWYLPEMPRAQPGSPAPKMEDMLVKADTFNTVEGFWSIYNALPAADALSFGEQFMFFRDPTLPRWEDPTLANGEMISLFTDHTDACDVFVQRFLMNALGETLTDSYFKGKRNVLAALRYSARRALKAPRTFKLDIWTTDASLHAEVEAAIKFLAEGAGIKNPQLQTAEFVKRIKS